MSNERFHTYKCCSDWETLHLILITWYLSEVFVYIRHSDRSATLDMQIVYLDLNSSNCAQIYIISTHVLNAK